MGDEKYLLHNNITSLQKLNCKINDTSIWMKRDDTLDFAFGGNKVRLFEYIIPEILSGGYKKIATFGSVFSNHNRVAAAVASKLNLECDLICLYDNDSKKSGANGMLVKKYFDANIIYCKTNEAHDFIDQYKKQQDESGVHYFWIPGGGHLPVAVNAYVDAMHETMIQAQEYNLEFDAVFLPTGTGTTQAGVLYALNNYSDCDVYGVTVSRSAERCIDVIRLLLENYDTDYVENNKIRVLKNVNLEYGECNQNLEHVIKSLAQSDGIVLDPVYNAKGFAGMMEEICNHQYLNVLYINTGGIPNIFN